MWHVEVGSPQFYGIVAGCVVYVVTVVAVVTLLFKSGSVTRMIDEVKQGKPIANSSPSLMPTRATLYDELIAARGSLPLKPNLPRMDGKFISLIPLVRRDQFVQLFNASDGSAIFDHGKYDPMRIWGFFAEGPFADSDAMMSADLFSVAPNDVQHFGIMDNITNRLTGSVSLRNNQPQNLSIEIDTLWISPVFQSKPERRAREAIYLLNKALFDLKYRRVQAAVDIMNVTGRKFFERCGFQQEGVLKKHRIVRLSNQDSVIYSITNSGWFGLAPSRPIKHHVEKMIYGKVLPTPKIDDEQPVQNTEPLRQPSQPTPKQKAKYAPTATPVKVKQPKTQPQAQSQVQSQPPVARDAEQDMVGAEDSDDEDGDELVEYAFYQSGFITTQGFSNLLNGRQSRLPPSVNKSRSTTDLQGLQGFAAMGSSTSTTSRQRFHSSVNAPLSVNEVTDDDMDDGSGEWMDASAMNARTRRRHINSKEL